MPDERPPGTGLQRAGAVIRRVCGMPDYDAHVAHLQAHHPGRSVPTRKEFFDAFLRSRYGDGPTRCC